MTSIQKRLGHRRLNSTMIYARVHNRTVAEDYYAAMAKIEKRLNLADATENPDELVIVKERTQLLKLVDLLSQTELDLRARLELTEQMRQVLGREPRECVEVPTNGKGTAARAGLASVEWM